MPTIFAGQTHLRGSRNEVGRWIKRRWLVLNRVCDRDVDGLTTVASVDVNNLNSRNLQSGNGFGV